MNNIDFSVLNELKNIIIKGKSNNKKNPKWFPNEKRLLNFFNRPTKKS